MSISIHDKPALILVDIQKGISVPGYYGTERNNPNAEDNAGILLRFWRGNGLPVFHVKHCSTTPGSPLAEGSPGNDILEIVAPTSAEPVIKKSVNSAFIGTDLQQQLDVANIKKLVIAGLTTDHCVSTTTRMAGNLGYETWLVADATATFDKKGVNGEIYSAELIHNTALASLNNEFATVVNTEELIELFNSQNRD
jgi:nicotinamidase-related amidase